MLTRRFQIKLEVGLYSRRAALFVQTCSRFESEIMVKKESVKVNAKSIIGVMGLAVADGDEIELIVDGADEVQALESVERFFEENMKHS